MTEPGAITVERRVCASRRHARELIEQRPSQSPSGAIYVRLDKVEVVTSPFVAELLDAWPCATPVGANEDVCATWRTVAERRK
jgi:hypothetical protein